MKSGSVLPGNLLSQTIPYHLESQNRSILLLAYGKNAFRYAEKFIAWRSAHCRKRVPYKDDELIGMHKIQNVKYERFRGKKEKISVYANFEGSTMPQSYVEKYFSGRIGFLWTRILEVVKRRKQYRKT